MPRPLVSPGVSAAEFSDPPTLSSPGGRGRTTLHSGLLREEVGPSGQEVFLECQP